MYQQKYLDLGICYDVSTFYPLAAWKYGPKLPVEIAASQMIEDPLGGVITIGGYPSITFKSFYRLAHAEAKWTKMSQTLSVGRWLHVAVPIPDSLANCTFV